MSMIWEMDMNLKQTKDELDLAVEEFVRSFNAFKKAAQNLMTIMDRLKKKKSPEFNGSSENNRRIHEFLIQMMDDGGQKENQSFGIKCLADEERK